MLDNPAPLDGLRVLVVEDEPLVAVMIEHYVADMGCRYCQAVDTTKAALEVLDIVAPDIVILDIAMAGTEPEFAVADELAARRIPFMFCTGYDWGILPDRHRTRPFIGKPFGADDISAALSRCKLMVRKTG